MPPFAACSAKIRWPKLSSPDATPSALPKKSPPCPGVTAVIGNSHKHQLAEIAASMNVASRRAEAAFVSASRALSLARTNQQLSTDQRTRFSFPTSSPTPNFSLLLFSSPATRSHENNRTRPNLKVQDGCDNRCSFCVIPSVRGHSRSLPLSQVICEVNAW